MKMPSWSHLACALLLSSAALRGDGGWTVTTYRAKPGYLLDSASGQKALDLIAGTPWLNPLSGELESPVAESTATQHAVINFTDPDAPGPSVPLGVPEPFPLGRTGVNDDHFALEAQGTL